MLAEEEQIISGNTAIHTAALMDTSIVPENVSDNFMKTLVLVDDAQVELLNMIDPMFFHHNVCIEICYGWRERMHARWESLGLRCPYEYIADLLEHRIAMRSMPAVSRMMNFRLAPSEGELELWPASPWRFRREDELMKPPPGQYRSPGLRWYIGGQVSASAHE